VEYTPNQVRIQTEVPVAGLLILSDLYFPGWQATVDGQPQPVYRADGILRGVQVPAGHHAILFTFRPPLLLLGVMISVAALLCTVILVVLGARQLSTDAL
jgi:uncharacterized membrane protein YfhO